MTTETTLATLPKEKSVEQTQPKLQLKTLYRVTQSNTAQDKSLEAKQLKEKVPVENQVEAKDCYKASESKSP